MNPEQLKLIDEQPRMFADNMAINHSRDAFLIGILSGGEAAAYVVTPAHAKGILNALNSHIVDYEKQFGTIDTSMPSLPSPFQAKDLGK
jgi:hypothetical protein